ncbi:unnamed protein product [Brassica oleracea var. botrytis]
MYKLCGEEACYESFLILAKLIGSPIKSAKFSLKNPNHNLLLGP